MLIGYIYCRRFVSHEVSDVVSIAWYDYMSLCTWDLKLSGPSAMIRRWERSLLSLTRSCEMWNVALRLQCGQTSGEAGVIMACVMVFVWSAPTTRAGGYDKTHACLCEWGRPSKQTWPQWKKKCKGGSNNALFPAKDLPSQAWTTCILIVWLAEWVWVFEMRGQRVDRELNCLWKLRRGNVGIDVHCLISYNPACMFQ